MLSAVQPIRQRQQRVRVAAFAMLFVTGHGSWTQAQQANAEDLATRSSRLLPQTLAIDQRAAEAFQARSLAALQTLVTDLKKATIATEAHMNSGGNVTGCDVASATLSIVLEFAVNKLDGEGRYQPWMRAQSLKLLADYQGYLQGCSADAGRPSETSQLKPHHVKAL